MSDADPSGGAIIKVDFGLGKGGAVTVFIQKISEGIAGLLKPWQMGRIAQAAADADRLNTVSKIENEDLTRRAIQRWVAEETRSQANIESITSKAIPRLEHSADPSKMENDWIANFFENCRNISDSEMQDLWAALLAGEANAPGTYSKRTVGLLATLDSSDAKKCAALRGWTFTIEDEPILCVFNYDSDFYRRSGCSFGMLAHLEDIGLIRFETTRGGSYYHQYSQRVIEAGYGSQTVRIEFTSENPRWERDKLRFDLLTGCAQYTSAGRELAKVCESIEIDGFVETAVDWWRTSNPDQVTVTTISKNKEAVT